MSDVVLDFFQVNIKNLSNYNGINILIKEISGINKFFNSESEAVRLLEKISQPNFMVIESNRREYGDYQTNEVLASQVVDYILSKKRSDFEFVLEPTCGKGNFLLALLKQSNSLKRIIGIEIYEPYVWETKFKILGYFLENRVTQKPEIDIICANVFDFSFQKLVKPLQHLNTLVIGNPPWITNSELSSINSKNLPQKSNFKKHKGLEAITGKGNFDIGEYISLLLLHYFDKFNGMFAFLLKNLVIKNIIYEQKKNLYRISRLEKLNIDSKKEFNASVNSSLFMTHLNSEPALVCKELDFYNKKHLATFGWHKNKFVSSVEDYNQSNIIDGRSIFTWRSGVKHDCSKIMEFKKVENSYLNGLGEKFDVENNLIYGLLKSSDLKERNQDSFRKLTIITQKKIGEETNYIEDQFPLTFRYLNSHKEYFRKRKSSIYKGKPEFSIFGIGDYSFTLYKVGISGLYKSTHFTLIMPKDLKPIMLDDTCYFIGFEKLIFAQIVHYLANSNLVQKFLKSIIFLDSKRPITKDVLMRIDFEKAFDHSDFEEAQKQIENLSLAKWNEFGKMIKGSIREQMTLF